MAEKQEKKQKRKPKYGMLSCAAYMFNMLWRHERGLALTGILLVPWSLGAAALGLYIPVIVIEYLEIVGGRSAAVPHRQHFTEQEGYGGTVYCDADEVLSAEILS